MAQTDATDLLRRALELPTKERLGLATELLNSVEGPEDGEWSAAWLEELDRRMKDVESGAVACEDWHTVKAQILEEIRSR